MRNNYRIYCNNCDQTVAKGRNLNDLMEAFFWQLAKHDTEDIKDRLCSEARDDISFSDVSTGFAGEFYEVQKAEEKTEVEWQSLS